MADLLITNVRPDGGETADILIQDGKFSAIGPDLTAPPGTPTHDGQGHIAIAPFVESHIHLDKILWGLPWQPITVKPELRAMIDNEKAIRRQLPWDEEERAGLLMRQCVAMGTTHIRSHVDIDTDYGLSNLHAVLRAHQKHEHAVGLELVAFPQTGMLINPGTADLMAAAIDEGAKVVGGIDPSGIDGDPRGHVDTIFAIADRKAAKIDIHLHEAGELGLFAMKLISERTRALGMQGRVVVSHAFCIGDAAPARQRALIEELAELRIGIISSVPGSRAVPPLFDLAAASVPCAIASDSLRDTWNPHGNGDMLERAWLLSWRFGLKRDDELLAALAMATSRGAALLELEGYGLAVGCEGSLTLIDSPCLPEAIVSRAKRTLTVKRGRIVTKNATFMT